MLTHKVMKKIKKTNNNNEQLKEENSKANGVLYECVESSEG